MLTILTLVVAGLIGIALAAEGAVRLWRGKPLLWPLGRRLAVDYPLAEFLQRAAEPLGSRLKHDHQRLPLLATNRLGLRGPAPDADGHKRRIWVAGGSACFGLGLPRQEDLWSVRLQQLLEAQGYAQFEVLNLSHGGYGNSQLVDWWKKMPAAAGDVLLFRPSFVNIRECRSCGATPAWQRAAGDENQRGGPPPLRWLRRLSKYSYLAADLERRFTPRPTEACRHACEARWAAFRERSLLALEELVTDAELKGVRVGLMTFFPAYRAEMDAAERRRLAAVETPQCRLEDFPVREQFELMDEAVERFVCRMGLPLLDLAPALWNHPRRCKLYLDPLHLSAEGHQVLAESLFAGLVESGLLAEDPLAVRRDPATVSAASVGPRPVCLPLGAR